MKLSSVNCDMLAARLSKWWLHSSGVVLLFSDAAIVSIFLRALLVSTGVGLVGDGEVVVVEVVGFTECDEVELKVAVVGGACSVGLVSYTSPMIVKIPKLLLYAHLQIDLSVEFSMVNEQPVASQVARTKFQ